MKRRRFLRSTSAVGAAGSIAGFFHSRRVYNEESDMKHLQSEVEQERMELMRKNIYYFKNPGPENTDRVIEAVKERLAEGDIDTIVVASTTGKTALRFKNVFAGGQACLVCVTEHPGYQGGDKHLFEKKAGEELGKAGIPVVCASHVLSGVGRSISSKFGGVTHVELIAHALRLLGQGVKVGVEISVMAADAGVISTDRDIIAVAGTGSGSDTATVLRPAHMNNFFNLKIREILAKPRL